MTLERESTARTQGVLVAARIGVAGFAAKHTMHARLPRLRQP